MLIKKKPSWHISENHATDEHIYHNRRNWLKAAGLAGLGMSAGLSPWCTCCSYHRLSGKTQPVLCARPRYHRRDRGNNLYKFL